MRQYDDVRLRISDRIGWGWGDPGGVEYAKRDWDGVVFRVERENAFQWEVKVRVPYDETPRFFTIEVREGRINESA